MKSIILLTVVLLSGCGINIPSSNLGGVYGGTPNSMAAYYYNPNNANLYQSRQSNIMEIHNKHLEQINGAQLLRNTAK